MIEIWRDIKQFENLYQVSNFGNVRSLLTMRNNKPHIMKKYISNTGYYFVKINKNRKQVCKTIHKIVSESFLNHIPCGYKLVINHIDGCKLNNNLNNLEIVTNRYNTADGVNRIKRTSSFHGVFLNKKINKWQTSIQFKSKNYYMGYYSTEEESSKIYNDAVFNIDNNNFLLWYNTLGINKNKISKYKGVSYIQKLDKWSSRIEKNKKRIFLGYFDNEVDAYNAYLNEKVTPICSELIGANIA